MVWRDIKIGDLFTLEKGSLQSTKCTPGEFDFITAAETWKTHNEYTHNCECLIFAAAASGSLGRVHYVSGKFITSDLCFILRPKNLKKYPLSIRFYYRILNSLRPLIVKATKAGTSKESISQSRLIAYEVPYVPVDLQESYIDKIDLFSHREKELTIEIEKQKKLLAKYRQAILQEAIEGKLTADWRAENPDVEPAAELLKRIAAEKAELVKQKKIPKQNPLPEIKPDEIPFDIPGSWRWCLLGEACFGFQYGTSSKSQNEGKVPVLRMGNIQNGLIDWNDLVYSNNDEEIDKFNLVSGDLLFNRTNSRELVGKTGLYRGGQQSIFAGYLVRFHMAGEISPEFTNFVMNSTLHAEWCAEVKSDAIGQSNINATKLSIFPFPLPPLAEQQEIVRRVEAKFALCDQLEAQINASAHIAETLSTAILQELFDQNGGESE